jgi:hypothetical protein
MRVLKIALDGNISQSASCGPGAEDAGGAAPFDGSGAVDVATAVGAALPPLPPPPHAINAAAVVRSIADAMHRDVRLGFFFNSSTSCRRRARILRRIGLLTTVTACKDQPIT